MAKLSGIQRDVLKLYRQCLRAIRTKPVENQQNFKKVARRDFERYLDVSKKDFATIEHLLRAGEKKLEMYSAPGVKNIMV